MKSLFHWLFIYFEEYGIGKNYSKVYYEVIKQLLQTMSTFFKYSKIIFACYILWEKNIFRIKEIVRETNVL